MDRRREPYIQRSERYIREWLARTGLTNRPFLHGFIEGNRARGLRPSSLAHYAVWGARLDRALRGRPFRDTDPKTIAAFLNQCRATMSESTIINGSTYAKILLAEALDVDRLPRTLRKAFHLVRNPSLIEPPIVPEAVYLALLEAARDAREEAMLAVLWETGFRNGEFCSLNVGSVVWNDAVTACWLVTPAEGERLKKGPREVPLVEPAAVARLKVWLSVHPHRDDSRAPLWEGLHMTGKGRRPDVGGICQWLRQHSGRAGVPYFHPHVWRHTAQTRRVAKGLSRDEQEKLSGWTKGSKMTSHYSHLNRGQIEMAARRAAGLNPDGTVPRPPVAEGDLDAALKRLLGKALAEHLGQEGSK